MKAPFLAALGADAARLVPSVAAFHAAAGQFRGRVSVTCGEGWFSRMALWLAGFPPPLQDAPFAITITRREATETWVRDFSGHRTQSTLRFDPRRSQVVERFGPVTCNLRLSEEDGALVAEVVALRVFAVPLPRRLILRTVARETAGAPGEMCFDIAAFWPTGLLLVRYRGALRTQP